MTPEERKSFNARTGPKRIKFKGKKVYLGYNPRKGICAKCRKTVASGDIDSTHMHHLQYDENDPAAHTVELCPSCHALEHADNNFDYQYKEAVSS